MKIKSKRLKKALMGFVDTMESRLAEKEKKGYRGWDDAAINGCTNASLICAIEEDVELLDFNISPVTCADIANRCMMLAYRINHAANKLR